MIGGQMDSKRICDFIDDIKDYYVIRTDGTIFSLRTNKELRQRYRAGTKYKIINLSTIDNKVRTFRVHRLVMMAFRPIENMKELEVNHIDGNKENNDLSNLEWCTPSENQKHAFHTGLQKARRGEKSNFSKLSEEQIKQIFDLRQQGWLQKDIAEVMGCTRSNISYILSNKTWQV